MNMMQSKSQEKQNVTQMQMQEETKEKLWVGINRETSGVAMDFWKKVKLKHGHLYSFSPSLPLLVGNFSSFCSLQIK